jgi:hypothetical protein
LKENEAINMIVTKHRQIMVELDNSKGELGGTGKLPKYPNVLANFVDEKTIDNNKLLT